MRMGRGVIGCVIPFLVIGGVLFGAGFAGAAFLVSALPGDDVPSPLPFAAVGAGGLVGFWMLALFFWRRLHPRRTRGLAVTVDRQRVRRGEPLRVQVSSGDSTAELGLVFRVHYDVYLDMGHHDVGSGASSGRATSDATAWSSWTPAGPGGVTLTVPPDRPPSYEGSAVSFAWAVHARPAGGGPPSDGVPVWVEP